MKKQKINTHPTSFIFNVDLLVEGEQNAVALEQLLHALNNCNFLDYRVLSGIQLGAKIDERKANAEDIIDIPLNAVHALSHSTHTKTTTPTLPEENRSEQAISTGFDNIKSLMKSNALVRLIVNKGLGIKLSIPCRIINMDETEHIITVYHVDEKQVYSFRLNEIEDFS